jgi:hypothetical protein
MLHVFIGEILANMTQVSDVAPGPLVNWRQATDIPGFLKFRLQLRVHKFYGSCGDIVC